MVGVIVKSTRTGVHGCDEHKISWIDYVLVGAVDRNSFIFEWLTESFENISGELGKFVKEEYAMVSKGNFARSGVGPSANDRDATSGVVRSTKRTLKANLIGMGVERMDFGDSNGLFRAWARK